MGWGKTNRTREVEVDALIGPQVVIHGDIVFSGGLHVEGRVVGTISQQQGANAVLTIAEQGVIEGCVTVATVVVAGRVVGEVHASERVELMPTARVEGNVHYDVVEMQAGAQLTGRLIHAGSVLKVSATPDEAEPVALLEATQA